MMRAMNCGRAMPAAKQERQGAAVGLAVEAKQEMGPGTDLDKRDREAGE